MALSRTLEKKNEQRSVSSLNFVENISINVLELSNDKNYLNNFQVQHVVQWDEDRATGSRISAQLFAL